LKRFESAAAYLAAFIITTAAWSAVLAGHGFIMHGDLAYPVRIETLHFNYYPMWDQHPSISNFDEIDRIFIMVPIFWAAKVLHMDVGLFSRLFSYLVSLGGSLSIVYCRRVFSSWILKRRASARVEFAIDVLAVILFSLNPWVLYRVEAPFFQMAYCFLPLFGALQLQFILSGRKRYLIGAVLAWTLVSGSPQYTIFTAILSIVFVLMVRLRDFGLSWAVVFSRYALMVAGYVVVNFYWIAAFFDINRITPLTPGYILHWTDVVTFSQNSTFYNVVSGLDVWVQWWAFLNPFAQGPIETVAAILRPSTFIIAIAFGVYYWRVRFFRVSAIAIAVLILLLQGAKGPIAPIYKFLVFNLVPGYGWIIRSPEKFGAFLWFFFALTISLGALYVATTRSKAAGVALSTVLAAVTLLAYFPVMYGTLFVHYVPVEIPQSYLRAWDFLENKHGKVLALADYEDLPKWVSGGATFKWAPQNMAGSTVTRSYPLPTFGVYHFTNPFAYFYSFIRYEGPSAAAGLAAMTGTRYIALEHDVDGNDQWYTRWSKGLDDAHFRRVFSSRDVDIFELDGVTNYEVKAGPYVVEDGDLDGLATLARRFSAKLSSRSLFLLEQSTPADALGLIEHASLVVLDGRSIEDLAADSFSPDRYRALPLSNPISDVMHAWAWERTSYREEENGGFWRRWEQKILRLPRQWVLDKELGVLTTAGKNAVYSYAVKPVPGARDVYVKYYSYMGARRPAVSVAVPGSPVYIIQGIDMKPRWRWAYAGRIPAGAGGKVTITSLTGIPVINTVLTLPAGALQSRVTELRNALRGKLVALASLRDLRRWPEDTVSDTQLKKNPSVRPANGSVVLDESYDPLWLAHTGESTMQSIPAWGAQNGFAPVHDDVALEFFLQSTVERWMKVEVVLIIAFLAVLLAYNGLEERYLGSSVIRYAPQD
jgi:hypothetical protein